MSASQQLPPAEPWPGPEAGQESGQSAKKRSRLSGLAGPLLLSAMFHGAIVTVAPAIFSPAPPVPPKPRGDMIVKKQEAPPPLQCIPLEAIEVELLSELEFEKIIDEKIAETKFYADTDDGPEKRKAFHELVSAYERRLNAYEKELFDDLKDDGKYDGKYIDFLIKTAAYRTSLENFQNEKLEILTVSTLENAWKRIIATLKTAMVEMPEDADELTKINFLQKQLQFKKIIRTHDDIKLRFNNILLQGAGTCATMSDLSFAAVEELLPTPHYLFHAYMLHRRTLLKTPKGTYFFNTNWINNQGHAVPGKDKGLTQPREVIIARYLAKWGYDTAALPLKLQWYFKQKKGRDIVHVDYNDDDILGDSPSRGYDINGNEEQVYNTRGPIDLQKELRAAAERKFAAVNGMSLSEILDQDFFVGEGSPLSAQPAGGYLYASSFFIKDKAKLREQLLRAIQQEVLGSLSKYQLGKLYRLIQMGYGGVGFPKELGGTQIPEALAQKTKEADLKEIVRTPWSQARADKIEQYVQQYAEVPVELAKLIAAPEYDKYKIFPIDTLRFPIRSILPESVRILTQASTVFKLGGQKWFTLGITHFPNEIAHAVAFEPDAIEFEELTINDKETAERIVLISKKVQRIAIKDITTPEAARAFVDAAPASLEYIRLNNPKSLTPEIAGIFASLSLRNFDIENVDDLNASTMEAIANSKAANLYINHKRRASLEHLERLCGFQGNLWLREGALSTPENIRILKNSKAKHIAMEEWFSFADRHKTVRDREMAKAFAEIPQLLLPNFGDHGILVKKYRTPHAGNEHDAEYYYKYGRINSFIVRKILEGEGLTFDRFALVSIDQESAQKMAEELKDHDENIGLFIVVEPPPPEAMKIIAPYVGNYEFIEPPSASALKNIVDQRKGKYFRIIFSTPPNEEQMKALVQHDDELGLTIPFLSPELARAAIPFKGTKLRLLVGTPVSEDAAIFIKKWNSTSDFISRFTPQAAAILGIPPKTQSASFRLSERTHP